MLRAAFLFASVAVLPPAGAVDFVKDIQPIFEQRCYSCHGGSKQEAAFRLDHKPSALKGGDFGLAIKPGHSGDSVLVHALEGRNPKLRMPRKGDPLSPEEIGKIKAWIDAGAEWPDSASVSLETRVDHWAFKAPVKAPLPMSGHPVDAFIRDRLKEEGLAPAPQAADTTLVRRLFLDLTGLPPEPGEVTRWTAALKEDGPDGKAYGRLVDMLLASPRYGERWGRHWLDAARYADSNGYEKDPMRHIWFYRDWVISAFNRDLPYDRFIIEQIAGDQLPKATQEQIVATGFLRNSMINEEGGVDPEQFRMEAMFDRMDTIGKSVLGLTIGCTQCHNHKYDPISQEEYYRMFAFLNNDNEPWRVVYTAAEQAERNRIRQGIRELEDKLKHENPDWSQHLDAWAAGVRGNQPAWTTLRFEDDPAGGEKALRQPDGSILAQGYAPTRSHVKFAVKRNPDLPAKITAFRLELLNDPNLPAYGPGRSVKGMAALTEFTAEIKVDGKPVQLKFARATADFGEPENTPLAAYARDKDSAKDARVTGPVGYAIDGNDKTAWGIDAGPGRRNVPRTAVFVLEKPLELQADSELTVGLSMKHGGWNSDDLQTMNLGRYRISATTVAEPVADSLPPSVRAWVEKNAKAGSGMEANGAAAMSFSHFRSTVAEWRPVNEQIEALWKQHPEGTTTLTLDAREEPRMTHLLKRGDFLKPGDRVMTGVPVMLNNPLPEKADGSRLTFARWLVSRQAPTTARAFVNRVWQAYFGTGLVDTPEDFGLQGSKPSHAGLLDWLAADFMDKGWSVKELHRLIVTSATYRQDSRVTPALLEKDPYNRLLARGPRFRVEGEVVRDIQLAVSGLLNNSLGGRSVMPPAPEYLFEKPASYAPFPWKVEDGAQKYRRSVYVFRRRSTPYPFLSTFDVPNGETACVKRARSNTPLQALMTLNETLSMEAAEHLAARMEKTGAGDDSRAVAEGFLLCTARKPTASEAAVLLGLLKRQRQAAEGDQAAPMVVVARVLLNLDETITKE